MSKQSIFSWILGLAAPPKYCNVCGRKIQLHNRKIHRADPRTGKILSYEESYACPSSSYNNNHYFGRRIVTAVDGSVEKSSRR